MSLIRTIATHQVVQALFPRVVTERDELGMAVGKAVDATLSRFSHEAAQGRRPTVTSMEKFGAAELSRELEEADLRVSTPDLDRIHRQIAGVIRVFRHSEAYGLPRPKSRLVLIDGRVGVYAQPDYWNGRDVFYEMKSYRALPPSPEVMLQLRLFQLGFPAFRAFLLCIDRHAEPPDQSLVLIPEIDEGTQRVVLACAYGVGIESGVDKVLEYIDGTIVRYDRLG